MTAWYDVKDTTRRGEEELYHIDETKKYVEDLIQNELDAGIPANRIVIGGFSQGAMTSYYVTYQLKYPLAGCIALSGYLLLFKSFEKLATTESKSTPLFIGNITLKYIIIIKILRSWR